MPTVFIKWMSDLPNSSFGDTLLKWVVLGSPPTGSVTPLYNGTAQYDTRSGMDPPRTPPSGPVASTSHGFHSETPSRPRPYASHRYRAGRLSDARDVVVEDLGDIPLVPVDFFLKSSLPPVNEVTLCEIKKTLVKEKHIKGKKWTTFPTAPLLSRQRETGAFSQLPTLFQRIVKAASSLLNSLPTLEFVYKPNNTPLSERNNATRPDAQLQLKEKKSLSTTAARSHWEDIIVAAFELKRDPKNWEENTSKLISNAHHIMRTDPCRRFTFGITIENTQTRLWLFTRSHVMVTHPFDFTTDLDIVIHLFTSLAFANDASLGFDPTVSRIRVGGHIRYRFQVGEEFYITKETLSDHAADFIRGRGTRVFSAYPESDPEQVVVLKDVWLEDDKTEEGNFLESMHASMKEMTANGTFSGNKDPSQYFLSVLAHGRVMVSGQIEDHTTNVIMRGTSLPSDREYFSTSISKATPLRHSRVIGSDRGYSKGHTPQVSREVAALINAVVPPLLEELRFQPRIHYRIIFNELGTTVHDLRSLSDVFQCLVDATTALEILHVLGYVHRDVSAGNLLHWNGDGKTGDLESVKKTTDLTVHEVRTGTNQFEPVEVRRQQYLFREDAEGPDPPFKFNCIHDLESTWWIALWVLFHHTPIEDEEDRSAQLQNTTKLFPPVGGSAERLVAVTIGIRKSILDLHPTFQNIAKHLITARTLLVERYKEAEKGPSINAAAFDCLHQEIRAIWQAALDESKAQRIEYKFVVPVKRRPTEEPTDQLSTWPRRSKKPRNA